MEWACPGLKESVDLEYSSSRGGGLVVSCDIHRWSMKAQCSLSNRMLELPRFLAPRKRFKTTLRAPSLSRTHVS